ncbi:hypothetical protein H0H81_005703 [Sphagnurus paluster]|uniref:Uncharacterized protein n=1 Tax=Sphagnurus paluster TaxID=117069 RepID=A0A9P7KL17_9AGAR|nr:hypothetical protein H0H81_005703 [Sphagnurus paluster]
MILNAREDLREKVDEPVSIHLSQISGSRHPFESQGPSEPVSFEKASSSFLFWNRIRHDHNLTEFHFE